MVQTLVVLLRNSQVSAYTITETFISIPIYLFYVITGIWLIIYLIQGKIHFSGSSLDHSEIIIPTLFIISLILLAISLTLHFICIFNNNQSEPEKINEPYDLESQLSLNRQHTLFLPSSESGSVHKKHSAQTLFEEEAKVVHSIKDSLKQPEFADENDEINYIIENSMKIHKNPQEISIYNEDNWMGSGNLHTLSFPEGKFTDTNRRNTYSSFGPVPKFSTDSLRKPNSFESLRKTHRQSTESLRKAHRQLTEKPHRQSSENLSPAVKHSLSTPVLLKQPKTSPFHSSSLLNLTYEAAEQNRFQYPAGSPSSTILSQTTLNPEDDTIVKRSKSASHLNGDKRMKREQRWKSIHDEKEFVLNVNESLLPSVLKSGESPIMKIKRQQEELEREQKQTASELSTRTSKQRPKFGDDTTKYRLKFSGDDRPKFSGDDVGELPYINELDEPLDHHAFAGFDQDTAMVMEQEEEDDDYHNALHGLEKIPRTKKTWLLNPESYENRSMSMNHISLHEWNDNWDTWVEQRTRSGANLSAGIRLVSSTKDLYLHPPVIGHCTDNVDSLSDLSGPSSENTRRPSYSVLNRSFSAPSLHTFRNVSDHSATSAKHSDISKDFNCITPVDTPIQPSSSGGSPIRKMFRLESPKKLTIFTSRKTPGPGHKHSESTASNQFSLSSAVSSKSSSPRKSFKSFVTRVNHRAHLSVHEKPTASENPPLSLDYYRHSVEFEMTAFQDLEPAPSSDRSRVSSVPSAVIGEYDREKWRTLKLLQGQ